MGRFLPEQTTAVSILDRLLHHATVVITDSDSYRMKGAQHRKERPNLLHRSVPINLEATHTGYATTTPPPKHCAE